MRAWNRSLSSRVTVSVPSRASTTAGMPFHAMIWYVATRWRDARAYAPPMNWARSVIRSPGLRGESSEWAMPSTASFTSTSMCSPSSLPCQSAAASSGYRDDRPARTLRTVAPGVSGSSRMRRPVPSPPTNFVTQEATSTGIVAAVAGAGLMADPSAAGRQQADQLRRHIGACRVVDETLLLAALDQPGAPQQVEVVRERRPRDVELGLDLAGRHLAPAANQQEEDLEAREVGERLERLDVILASLQPSERKGLHVSKSIIGAGALEAGLDRGWPERDASRLRSEGPGSADCYTRGWPERDASRLRSEGPGSADCYTRGWPETDASRLRSAGPG